MSGIRRKLIAAVLSMTIAVGLLVSATLAWFTISTAPEIDGMHVALFTDRTLLLSSDGVNYQQYINLSSQFQNFVALRPVSTADGRNWFLPAYDASTGALKDTSKFILDNTLAYANVNDLAYNEDGTLFLDKYGRPVQLDGYELRDREAVGYYVYGEFWLKTEEQYGARVRLTVPSLPTAEDTESGVYGTYVLSTPSLTKDENGANTITDGDGYRAETAMRVGFLVNPTQKAQSSTGLGGNDTMISDPSYNGAYEGNAFYIYEPNADVRSAAGKPLADDSGEVDYIVGYQFNSETYTDDYYFVTQPIGVRTSTSDATHTTDEGKSGTGAPGGKAGETGSDGTQTDSVLIPTTETESAIFGPVDLDFDHLLIQKACTWNKPTVTQKLVYNQPLNSSDVQFPMGGFLRTDELRYLISDDVNSEQNIENTGRVAYLGEKDIFNDIAGSSVIVTLQRNEPVKVRLFVWIEGQDVDCWNDIAAGSFRVNLELAGETLEKPEDTVEFKGHSYKACLEEDCTYEEARQRCIAMGGHIAVIDGFSAQDKKDFANAVLGGIEKKFFWVEENGNGTYTWLYIDSVIEDDDNREVNPGDSIKEEEQNGSGNSVSVSGGNSLNPEIGTSGPTAGDHIAGFICQWG